MENHPLIHAVNISRSLPMGSHRIQILKGISFQISPGDWVALMGPSGSGKSTLLGIIGGMDRLTSGSLFFDGLELNALSENRLARIRNERIGVVFQSFHLIPGLTAQENIEIPLYIGPHRRQASAMAREMLEVVGLGERANHLPAQLSGGEQQRVAIARALVSRPDLLLADEPTGNLDRKTGKQVLDLIGDLRTNLGLTVIMVTHDPEVAMRADHRLHLVDGVLIDNPAAEVVL
jgi:putative ABC transport system ATP-binding protein